MPFRLKSAGATYQRLVNRMFAEMLGNSMEVYIDDMLVKSLVAQDHLDHLQQAFKVLEKYNMKLNPAKCSFAISSGKFLGNMVTKRGIEANLEQIRPIQNIQPHKNIKDIQCLNGRIAALSRFISKSSERCHIFFSKLRKTKDFIWTEECQKALNKLKAYLSSLPLTAKPKDGETLYIYLAVSETTVSAVLVREENGKQQPVYYISKTLLNAETRYNQLEKLALALVTAGRKLRPYFQCHPIVVLTQYPLRAILHKPELSGRLTKWAVELSEYDITFQPRTAIKSQVLADFIADFSSDMQIQAEKELLCLEQQSNTKWRFSVDGSSNSKGCGLGIVLTTPTGDIIQRSIRCKFKATNNEEEYEALIAGLDLAKELNIKNIKVTSDSQLVVNQLNGTYQAKDSKMTTYLEVVKKKVKHFNEFSIVQVPRLENDHADALANLGSTIQIKNEITIPVVYMQWPAVWKQPEQSTNTIDTQSWMTPIIEYLLHGTLPEDKNESRKLRTKAARFTLSSDRLYERSFTGPLLRCLNLAEEKYILTELHEGECGNHSGSRSLCNKALTTRLLWPRMRKDSFDLSRSATSARGLLKCHICHLRNSIQH